MTLEQTKKIGIFGLARTGMAAFNILKDSLDVICYDNSQEARAIFIDKYGSDQLIDLSDTRWSQLDNILLSPGVSLAHPIIKIAQTANIEIISDIDLFYKKCKNANFVAITGTNGKSTTTRLVTHILQSSNYDYLAGGNIGEAIFNLPLDKAGYVIELSSFQLDLNKYFKANIAIILNITPDHLDRHINMEKYIEAKEKIFHHLTNDSIGIINVDNIYCRALFAKLSSNQCGFKLIPISSLEIQKFGISALNGKIYDHLNTTLSIIDLPQNESLRGEHNRENIAAAYATCRAIGISPNSIIEAIPDFKGLMHRMQYVGSIKEIGFYNDSKATNLAAAEKSIMSLDNIYWLAGGIIKEHNLDDLKPWFYKIKRAYLFGRDKQLFAAQLSLNNVGFKICETLEKAVITAFSDALQDVIKPINILLAPAAASQDQFKDFEHRGNLFIELYHKLSKASLNEVINLL